MLFSRYGGAYDTVCSFLFEDFFELLKQAIKEKHEEFIKLRWINGHQENYSLEDFKIAIGCNNNEVIEQREVPDILSDLQNVFG